MPIKCNGKLPAVKTLKSEGVFVMTSDVAERQDIRPLKIAILNLMPLKIQTETQFLRLLGCTPLQVEITLIYPKTHTPKNISGEYLKEFYKTFDQVCNDKFDGLIVTGAPLEQMPFEQVTYWDELVEIFEWSKRNVYSTIHICWGAQAGLYYHFGVKKYPLEEKLSGVYKHECPDHRYALTRGFDDYFFAPHSRYTCVLAEDIEAISGLDVLCSSKEAGPYLISTRHGRQVFITGHPEYDRDTLKTEYLRDIGRGLNIKMPQNYFVNDDVNNDVINLWQGHANLLFRNWLNYYVYQETPYDIGNVGPIVEIK